VQCDSCDINIFVVTFVCIKQVKVFAADIFSVARRELENKIFLQLA
jgi:hypothetical protein